MTSITSHLLNAVFLLLSLLLVTLGAFAANLAPDILNKGRNITDGETLVSASGSFTLGFFSPGVPTKRYLGIWFSVYADAVYWVANRDRPLTDASGALVIGGTGSLLLLDGSGQVVWSSNTTGTAASTMAQLLESGNLVVSDPSSRGVALWQSFDHPLNTLLPGMKIGKNLWTGAEWYLSSWRSANDPSTGNFRYTTDTKGVPQNVLLDGDIVIYSTGPWNGLYFSGIPEMRTYSDMFTFQLTTSPSEITYGYLAKAGAPFSRIVLTDGGVVQRLVWNPSSGAWKTFFQGPWDVCDNYGKCGAFGQCNADASSTSFCSCMKGFSPASPSEWKMRDYSSGCRRNVALDCADNGTTTDGFVALQGMKLPDTHNASVDASITLEECSARCLANCSCVAYAALDIRRGGEGSGCVIWTDNIVDLRSVDRGQDLHLRSAKSELAEAPPTHRRHQLFPTALVIGAPIASLLVVLLVVLSVVFVIRRRRRRQRISEKDGNNNPVDNGQRVALADDPADSCPNPASTVRSVPAVDLPTIQAATENFSEGNIIGRGGFGLVYKGQLPDGRKVAVKRLIQSRLTDEVKENYRREVRVMSKAMHVNLVELLCRCQEGDEWILVYEYMQKKSLDLYIFGDPGLRASLDWAQRVEIIHGIAQGVAYLHEGLSEKVIHRDLKASNILLDDNWKPKIADFGTAKLIIEDQTNPTLVQSAGYTAPEYAPQGNLTLKCDVYSFGVVVLEIVSGKRNSTEPELFLDAGESLNQVNQHAIKDILDSEVPQPELELLLSLERCIHIGLLCVQQSPDERPTMSEVVTMLNSDGSPIRTPNRPGFKSRTWSPLREADPVEASETPSTSHSRSGASKA